MYSYKLNNSYTVYVNHEFLNECSKANKKKKYIYYLKNNKSVVPSLRINTMFFHKEYGAGKVVSKDKNGIILVAFKDGTVMFKYPDDVKKGLLRTAQ